MSMQGVNPDSQKWISLLKSYSKISRYQKISSKLKTTKTNQNLPWLRSGCHIVRLECEQSPSCFKLCKNLQKIRKIWVLWAIAESLVEWKRELRSCEVATTERWAPTERWRSLPKPVFSSASARAFQAEIFGLVRHFKTSQTLGQDQTCPGRNGQRYSMVQNKRVDSNNRVMGKITQWNSWKRRNWNILVYKLFYRAL